MISILITLYYVNIVNAVDEADTDTAAEVSNLEMNSTAPLLQSDASGSFLLPEGQFDLQVSYLNIPPDQTRTIHNIDTLISEVGSVSAVDSSFLLTKKYRFQFQFQFFFQDSIYFFFFSFYKVLASGSL